MDTLLVPYGVIKTNQLTEPMMVPIPKKLGEILNVIQTGKLSEWLMEHAWKACAPERVPRVRIPHFPPNSSVAQLEEQLPCK